MPAPASKVTAEQKEHRRARVIVGEKSSILPSAERRARTILPKKEDDSANTWPGLFNDHAVRNGEQVATPKPDNGG
jgi:hypothetical protein